MTFFKIFSVFVFSATLFSLSTDAFAAGDPSECVITIKEVQLKKDSGEWITVIEPDHQVDLVNQEPMISFFNNGRRVPPGDYSNFKILLLRTIKIKNAQHFSLVYESPNDEIAISGSEDFLQPLKVKRGSFISVRFVLDLSGTIVDTAARTYFLPPKKVKGATVAVDDQIIELPGGDIRMVF